VAVELRDARHGDELAVAELHVRSWQEAYRGLLPDEFLDALDPRVRAARYRFEATEEGAMRTLLATSAEAGAGDRIVGFVTFGRSRDVDLPDHAEVGALYVDPDRHHGGVGRLLMVEARRRLVAAGYTEALLWVLRGNTRAADFYAREGWSADGSSRLEDPYGVTSTVDRFRRALP
jgi:ribosomal protein S18 acetylase RimI-like enzyme